MFKIYCARLVVRIGVLMVAIQMYLRDKNSLIISKGLSLKNGIKPLHLLWMILAVEMISKFFPQKITSIGCRKQFKANYRASERMPIKVEITNWKKQENIAAKKVFAGWFGGNALIAILYFTKVLSESEMVLLSLFYFVGDLICVVLFCPFQSFIMENRCCITCRIFNWDSMMFCTPLIFIRSIFSWSLVLIALVLLVWWEFVFWKYPQRFFEKSNENLKCQHCNEHLCLLKKLIAAPRRLPKRRLDDSINQRQEN